MQFFKATTFEKNPDQHPPLSLSLSLSKAKITQFKMVKDCLRLRKKEANDEMGSFRND